MASGNPDETYEPMPMRPEFQEREARLELLEEQGVERCVLYPSTMALSVEQYVTDTPVAYANIHSFNRWFDETWGFDRDRDLAHRAAVAARPRPLGRRARGRPGPWRARGPAPDRAGVRALTGRPVLRPDLGPDQRSRRRWSPSTSWSTGTTSTSRPAWGHEPVPAPWHMSAWQWQNTYGERPIEDTLSALIFDNLFGRFPDSRCWRRSSARRGCRTSSSHMDKSRGMGRNGPWIGGQLRERPSEIFRRHVRVAPYPEDDVVEDRRATSATPTGS